MIKRILCLLLAAFLFAGCEGGYTGDWRVELHSDYAIDRPHRGNIMIVHRNDPNDSTWLTAVITHYFVTAFWEGERYIAVEGIPMQDANFISDAERESDTRSYYLVDAVTAEVQGPFEKEEFLEEGEKLGLLLSEGWTATCEIKSNMPQ